MRGFEYLLYSAFSLTLLVIVTVLPLAPVFASEIEGDTSTINAVSGEVRDSETEQSQESEEEESEEILESLYETIADIPESANPEENIVDESAQNTESQFASEDLIALPVDSQEVIDSEYTAETGSIDTDQLPDETNFTHDDSEEVSSSSLLSSATTSSQSHFSDDSGLEEATTTIPEEESIAVQATATPTLIFEELEELEEVPVVDVIVSTTSVSEEELNDEVTSEEVAATAVEDQQFSSVVNDSAFSFSKNECVSVGNGSFYCSNATTTPNVIGIDRVFSATDGSNDREIYIERNGEIAQITDNIFDDDAPFFDTVSDTIVWHRLIDGRYQIISYDTETDEETQVTHEKYNNMEPSRYGGVMVWQGWVGNDWEVMLEDDGELIMVTDNTVQDVSPRINGNYIIWQSFEEGAWRVKVYDLITQQIETIADSDGASVDNPRFVLVYDTRHENGDIETKGYDLKSGKVTPLTATPAPVPDTIPDPEQTGEDRALVAPQTQLKTKSDDESDAEPHNDDTDSNDIVIPPFEEDNNSTSSPRLDSVDADSQEMVLSPIVEADGTTTSITHIEDIVVPPYEELENLVDSSVIEISDND